MSDVSQQQIVDVLHRAPEIINQIGWVQRSYVNEQGVCAMGAISIACNDLGLQFTIAPMLAAQVLQRFTDDLTIPSWNDAPLRTVEDVLLAFKRAEELAQSAVSP